MALPKMAIARFADRALMYTVRILARKSMYKPVDIISSIKEYNNYVPCFRPKKRAVLSRQKQRG
jgi:hypothetical protein